jgi:sulfur carrier protein ThiS
MRLHLAGHLGWYVQKKSWVDVRLAHPTRLIDVLEQLGVPIAEIAVGTLNRVPVFSFDEVMVNDSDVVELFPPVGGG